MVFYIVLGVIGWLVIAAITRDCAIRVARELLFNLSELRLSIISIIWPLFWLWVFIYAQMPQLRLSSI